MGQLPGPSYPHQWSDEPRSPDEPPEPSWRRGFVLAVVMLGLLVLGGFAISACTGLVART